MNRSAGMLLHSTSLPGPYGIGKLGKQAVEFAKKLSRCGFTWWQLLPFGPPAAGYSPYKCYSAFAGNPMLIDPDWLFERDLLLEEDVAACRYDGSAHLCDYVWVEKTTDRMLRQAFTRMNGSDRSGMERYVQEQSDWLMDYACFRTAKDYFDGLPWWQWPQEALVRRDEKAVAAFAQTHRHTIDYYCFIQYLFDLQWNHTRGEIARAGVKLIGDIPIYVSLDSSDVWANSQYFDLDETLRPIHVAGVPPDYFSADGQLWGNPLYRWNALSKDKYSWWVQRVGHALQWFDCVRLDHFRGFDSYYAVAVDAENAREGTWLPGPGESLFDVLFDQFGKSSIIAEDLGDIDESVHDLRHRLGLPGMRVLQFGFDPASDSVHLPCHYPEDSVAFTGTHDNNTLLGWLWSIRDDERQFALEYAGLDPSGLDWGCGGTDSPVIRALIRTVWASSSALAIAPIQDFLGFGSDTRLNIPGEPDGQWRFRITADDLERLDEHTLWKLNRIYRRCSV